MTTALDIITDALNRIGVYAAGETLSDADAQQGLAALNDVLDSWSNQSLACYAIQEQSFALQVGVSAYTIGPGGMFNGTRPLRILDAPGRCYLQDQNQTNYPIQVVQRDQWNLIGTRNIDSNIPDTVFYDPQYPLGVLNFFPTPNISYNVFFDSYLQLADLATLYTTLALPPGYSRALKTNLALELWSYFKDGPIAPTLVRAAMESLGDVKRTNTNAVTATIDPGMGGESQGRYNIYSDSMRI